MTTNDLVTRNMEPFVQFSVKRMEASALLEENEKLKKEIANHQVVNSLMAGDDLEVSLANKVYELRAEVDRLTKEKSELVQALTNMVHAQPNDSTWNYPAAWESARSLLTRIK